MQSFGPKAFAVERRGCKAGFDCVGYDREDVVDIADKGSAANILAKKSLNYAYENGFREIREAI